MHRGNNRGNPCKWCQNHGYIEEFSFKHRRECPFFQCKCALCARPWSTPAEPRQPNRRTAAYRPPAPYRTPAAYRPSADKNRDYLVYCVFCKHHDFHIYANGQHSKYCKFRDCQCSQCAKAREPEHCLFCKNHNKVQLLNSPHERSCKLRNMCECELCAEVRKGHLKSDGVKGTNPSTEQKTETRPIPGNSNEASSAAREVDAQGATGPHDSSDGRKRKRSGSPPPALSKLSKTEQPAVLPNCPYCFNHGWKFQLKEHHHGVCMYRQCDCELCEIVGKLCDEPAGAELVARGNTAVESQTAVKNVPCGTAQPTCSNVNVPSIPDPDRDSQALGSLSTANVVDCPTDSLQVASSPPADTSENRLNKSLDKSKTELKQSHENTLAPKGSGGSKTVSIGNVLAGILSTATTTLECETSSAVAVVRDKIPSEDDSQTQVSVSICEVSETTENVPGETSPAVLSPHAGNSYSDSQTVGEFIGGESFIIVDDLDQGGSSHQKCSPNVSDVKVEAEAVPAGSPCTDYETSECIDGECFIVVDDLEPSQLEDENPNDAEEVFSSAAADKAQAQHESCESSCAVALSEASEFPAILDNVEHLQLEDELSNNSRKECLSVAVDEALPKHDSSCVGDESSASVQIPSDQSSPVDSSDSTQLDADKSQERGVPPTEGVLEKPAVKPVTSEPVGSSFSKDSSQVSIENSVKAISRGSPFGAEEDPPVVAQDLAANPQSPSKNVMSHENVQISPGSILNDILLNKVTDELGTCSSTVHRRRNSTEVKKPCAIVAPKPRVLPITSNLNEKSPVAGEETDNIPACAVANNEGCMEVVSNVEDILVGADRNFHEGCDDVASRLGTEINGVNKFVGIEECRQSDSLDRSGLTGIGKNVDIMLLGVDISGKSAEGGVVDSVVEVNSRPSATNSPAELQTRISNCNESDQENVKRSCDFEEIGNKSSMSSSTAAALEPSEVSKTSSKLPGSNTDESSMPEEPMGQDDAVSSKETQECRNNVAISANEPTSAPVNECVEAAGVTAESSHGNAISESRGTSKDVSSDFSSLMAELAKLEQNYQRAVPYSRPSNAEELSNPQVWEEHLSHRNSSIPAIPKDLLNPSGRSIASEILRARENKHPSIESALCDVCGKIFNCLDLFHLHSRWHQGDSCEVPRTALRLKVPPVKPTATKSGLGTKASSVQSPEGAEESATKSSKILNRETEDSRQTDLVDKLTAEVVREKQFEVGFICYICGVTFPTAHQYRLHAYLKHNGIDIESTGKHQHCRTCPFEDGNEIFVDEHESAHMGLVPFNRLFYIFSSLKHVISNTQASKPEV